MANDTLADYARRNRLKNNRVYDYEEKLRSKIKEYDHRIKLIDSTQYYLSSKDKKKMLEAEARNQKLNRWCK